MGSERSYYVAAGESLKAIEAMNELRKECNRKRDLIAKRFGASAVAQLRGEVLGFVFENGNPPLNWKNIECHGTTSAFAPQRRSKADKALWKEIDETKWGDSVGEFYVSGNAFLFPLNFELQGKWIISQHKDAKPPAGAILLKMSEFWKMVEDEKSIGAEAK